MAGRTPSGTLPPSHKYGIVQHGTAAPKPKPIAEPGCHVLQSVGTFAPLTVPRRRLVRLSNNAQQSRLCYAETASALWKHDLGGLPQPPNPSHLPPREVARPRWVVACCRSPPVPRPEHGRVWDAPWGKSFRGPRTGPRRAGSCRLMRPLASASSHMASSPQGQRGGAAELTHLAPPSASARAQGIRPWPCRITVPDAGHKRGVIGLRGSKLFTSAGANGSDGLSLGGDGGVFCLQGTA